MFVLAVPEFIRTNWMFHVSMRGSAHQAGTSENLGFSQECFPEDGTEAFGHVLQ